MVATAFPQLLWFVVAPDCKIASHGASCVWDVHYLLSTGGLGAYLSLEERFSSIVAAAVHDFRHPGVSNAYLVRSHHPLAICHNDDAVLERFHVSSAFMVSREHGCEVFKWLSPDGYKRVRSLVIAMVLATVRCGRLVVGV